MLLNQSFRVTYNNKTYKDVATPDAHGDKVGSVVLTGSPNTWEDVRKAGGGKYYEFVFPKDIKEKLPVSAELFDHYKFIYDRSDDAGKKEWKRIRDLVEQEELSDDRYPGAPVFFRQDAKGNVTDFGFALLYKLPYKRTPYDTLPDSHKSPKMDLAECIFGRIAEADGESFKGRVAFSNAFAVPGTAVEGEEVTVTPGSPKASYYPCYVSQGKNVDGNKGTVTRRDGKDNPVYNSYDNDQIRGWKRYVVKNNARPEEANPENQNTNVTFKPLKENAKFTCDFMFFNLRPVELGALLSAITFHGKEADCRHQFGGGKPYGYGRTKVQAELQITDDGHTADYYLGCFENAMETEFPGWRTSGTLKELFSMADVANVPRHDNDYRYMTLTVDDQNDFVRAKQEGYYLRPFTEQEGKSSIPASFRQVFADEKKQEAAAQEAQISQEAAAIGAKLDSVQMSEQVSEEGLCAAIEQVAAIAKEAERFSSAQFDCVKALQTNISERVSKIGGLVDGKLAEVKAMPQVSAAEIEAKRSALTALKDLVAKVNANLPSATQCTPVDVDLLIDQLPKAKMGSIAENVTFKKRAASRLT